VTTIEAIDPQVVEPVEGSDAETVVKSVIVNNLRVQMLRDLGLEETLKPPIWRPKASGVKLWAGITATEV
jgi:hypothetical protein